MVHINKHRGNIGRVLDGLVGTLEYDAGAIEYRIKLLTMVTEQLIREKLEAFVADNPGTKASDLVITIENDWTSLWEGGPMRMVKKVVITRPEEVVEKKSPSNPNG